MMQRFLLTISVMFVASHCEAGYIEYQLLAESSCEAFAISTDAAPPQANAPDASPEYKAYVSRTNRSTTDFWSLNGNPELPTRWADCQSSESEIACTVIGDFRFQSFKCRLGQSKEWSRSCLTAAGTLGELKIYSVDTSEYELGGEPIQNRYLQADRTKFDARCKKNGGKK
jgi:hypothetical protein